MVLSPPAAHDEVPPHEADWVEPIRRELALSGARGILVHVEHRLGRPLAPATAKRALDVFAGAQIADDEKTVLRGELEPIAAAVAPGSA